MRSSLFLLAALVAAPAGAVVTGSGFDARYGAPVAVQTTGTGFGNNYSELDALFAAFDGAQACFGIGGNMEGNGNAVVILLDTQAGGDETLGATTPDLGGTGKIRGAYGKLTFDAGFRPDMAISFDRYNGGVGNDNVYGNYINLLTGANEYIGFAPTDGGAGGSHPDFSFALNNTNTGGVGANGSPNDSDPASVTTGLEFCVNASFLGLPGSASEIKALVYLAGGGGDYFSNQFLPAIPGKGPGAGNYEGGPIDFRQITGDQFVTLRAGTVIPEPGAFALLASGALAFLPFRRRKAAA